MWISQRSVSKSRRRRKLSWHEERRKEKERRTKRKSAYFSFLWGQDALVSKKGWIWHWRKNWKTNKVKTRQTNKEIKRCMRAEKESIQTTMANFTIFDQRWWELTSSPLHLFTSSPLHLFTSSPLHLFTSSPLHLFTSSPLHLFTSSPLHLFTSSPLHLFTSSPLHLFTSSPLHLFTSSPLHLFTSSPLHLFTSSPPRISLPLHFSWHAVHFWKGISLFSRLFLWFCFSLIFWHCFLSLFAYFAFFLSLLILLSFIAFLFVFLVFLFVFLFVFLSFSIFLVVQFMCFCDGGTQTMFVFSLFGIVLMAKLSKWIPVPLVSQPRWWRYYKTYGDIRRVRHKKARQPDMTPNEDAYLRQAVGKDHTLFVQELTQMLSSQFHRSFSASLFSAFFIALRSWSFYQSCMKLIYLASLHGWVR